MKCFAALFAEDFNSEEGRENDARERERERERERGNMLLKQDILKGSIIVCALVCKQANKTLRWHAMV